MKNLIIIDHPLVKRDLTLLRNRKTPSHQFRAILRRTASLMAYEVSRDLQVKKIEVHTPLEKTKGVEVDQQIVGGFVEVMPNARVGHIGLFRDEETLKPVDYYFKVPRNLDQALVLLLDPMLATGGSAVAAISFLKERGASTIRLVNLVSAPEGVRRVRNAHPDVLMYSCALDRGLNSRGYILPGLGDAGDRMFGTE